MTPRQQAVIDRASQQRARFVDIERTTRFTSHRNTMKALSQAASARVSALLEAEQQRLAQTWSD
jgi:hypothetical protein